MNWGSPEFVIAIIAVCMIPWIITTWIKAKHGYPLDDGAGNTIERSSNADADRLRTENAELKGLLVRLEDRTRVLERIVTDKGYDVASQIEALRDTRRIEDVGAGVALDFAGKERV